MIIARLGRSDNGIYKGFVPALDLNITIEPNPSIGNKFKIVVAHDVEVGEATCRTGKDGKKFLAIILDTPSLTAPIHCRLLDGEQDAFLIWQRDERAEGIRCLLRSRARDGAASEDAFSQLLDDLQHFCEASGYDFERRLGYLRGNADEIGF